jgi:hypothetical protein
LGETSPLRLTTFTGTSGDLSSANIYNLSFTSISSYEPKEISCLDTECYTSFTANESRQSTFVIENVSSVDFGTSSINITADSTPLNLSYGTSIPSGQPNQPIQPNLWATNPTILQSDTDTFLNLISGYTNSINVGLYYDALDDVAYIVLNSLDTSFSNLYFDSNPEFLSQVNVTLNIDFTLGNLLVNSGTIITVTDNLSNIVYSGLYNQQVVGYQGVTGLTNNSYIEVGNLYPTGVTFTLTMVNSSSTCPDREFTYTPEVLVGCSDYTTISLTEGKRYTITFDKFDVGLEYRNIHFNYNGYYISLYADNNNQHSSFNQFESDFRAALLSFNNSGIDYSALLIIDQPKTVYITFLAEQDKVCYIRTFGNSINNSDNVNDSNNGFTSRLYPSESSVVGEFQTSTTGNRIRFIDYDLQEVAGNNGSSPDFNSGIYIETTTMTTGEINSLGIDVSAAQVSDDYTQVIESEFCPNHAYNYKIGSCAESLNKTTSQFAYSRFSIQTSSTLLSLTGLYVTTSINTQFVTGKIDLSDNITDFSESFKQMFPDFILLSLSYLASNST